MTIVSQREIDELITIHKHRLQKLKEKKATYGINVPPEVLIEIDLIEAEIEELTSKVRNKISENSPEPAALLFEPAQYSKIASNLSDLLRRIRITLQECEQFETNRKLRTVFMNHIQLRPWRNRLPQEDQLAARVSSVVAFLYEKRSRYSRTNALVIFLQILGDEYEPDDNLHFKLKDLASQLESYL